MKNYSIAGISLAHPVFNAAGPWKTLTDIQRLATSKSAAVLVGSITLKPRLGNTRAYHRDNGFSLNSFGLPNKGLPFYKRELPKMARVAHEAGKPFFVSIAGTTGTEFAILAHEAEKAGADMLELNVSCPNATGHLICFSPRDLRTVLSVVGKTVRIPFSVKVSPFSDPHSLAECAKILERSAARAIVTSNTFPNASAKHFYGGLSGAALKPIALGQVRQLKKLLPKRISIIGVGGIQNKNDVKEFLNAGADAVQIATLLYEKGPAVFKKLQ